MTGTGPLPWRSVASERAVPFAEQDGDEVAAYICGNEINVAVAVHVRRRRDGTGIGKGAPRGEGLLRLEQRAVARAEQDGDGGAAVVCGDKIGCRRRSRPPP